MENRLNLVHNNRDIYGLTLKFIHENTGIHQILASYQLDDISTELTDLDHEFKSKCKIPKFDSRQTLKYVDEHTKELLYNPTDVKLDWKALSEQFVQSDLKSLKFLTNRGVSLDLILKYKVIPSEYVSDEDLVKLGGTIHPSLKFPITERPQSVIFPIFRKGQFIGSHCRFLNTLPYVKFSSSIPTFYLYRQFNNKKDKNVWVTEGVFDAFALDRFNVNWLSLSSGYASEPQMYNFTKELSKNNTYNLILDNDAVGFKSAWYMFRFLRSKGYNVDIYKLPDVCKDLDQAVNQHYILMDDLILISEEECLELYNKKVNSQELTYEEYLEHRKIQSNELNYCY